MLRPLRWLILLHLICTVPVATVVHRRQHNFSNCSAHDLRYFDQQGSVEELTAEHCTIWELENAVFLRYRKLTSLELVDSKLATLQDYALNGLNQLRVLSLARNNISHVKSWSNEAMRSLVSLDLHRNSIRSLSLYSFIRYPQLQRLNLAHNLLDDVEDGVFRWLSELRYLNLGRNLFKTIATHQFLGLNRLTHLSLYSNQIDTVEPLTFETLCHLRALRLEGNDLRNLEFIRSMKLSRLVHLNLSHNAIGEMMDRLTFGTHHELRDLDLSRNHLKEVTVDAFKGLESLNVLNISHNVIYHIEPKSFNQLIHLEHIDLSANNVSQIPQDLFSGSTELQHINLSSNALKEVDAELFVELSQLGVLDLSANALQSTRFLENLSDGFNRSQLQLNLSGNRLRLLNMSVLAGFQSVQLAENAWSCQWLMQEGLGRFINIHFGRNYSMVNAAVGSNGPSFEVSGIDCYDERLNRSVILLLPDGRPRNTACESDLLVPLHPSPPLLIWPRIHLDKFDSRSVIIWLLIGIAVIFSALRFARQKIEQGNRRKESKEMWTANEDGSADAKPLNSANAATENMIASIQVQKLLKHEPHAV